MGERDGVSRVTRSKKEAIKNYNRLARRYSLFFGSFEEKHRLEGLKRLELKPGEKVLEVGFGPGKSLVSIARDVAPGGRVFGVDISPEMCRVARSRVIAREEADLVCGDAESLPFKDCSFHTLFMSFTLELFDSPEIPRVIGECRRVLVEGGKMGVVALSKKGGAFNPLYELGHRLFPSLLDCRPIFAARSLEEGGFSVMEGREGTMLGLGVEVVVARKG